MNRKAFGLLIAGLACLALLVGGSPARAADPIVIPPGGPEAPYPPAGGDPLVVPGRLPVGADTYTGTLNIISGDPQDFAGEPVEHYFLARPDGVFIELRLTDAVARADLYALNGKPVIVTGRPPASEPSTSALGEPVVLTVTAIQAAEPRAVEAAAITGNTKWVTIACKFADIADEPRPLSYFQGMYANAYPGLDAYWREASYGNINLAGSSALGWFVLPKPMSAYQIDNETIRWEELLADCAALADPFVYFPDFKGINLMINGMPGCCAWGGNATTTLDGVARNWSVTWLPPFAYTDQGVIQHEMTHAYGILWHSYAGTNPYGDPWDVVSDHRGGWRFYRHPVYGIIGPHTIAYHRDYLGWIPANRKITVGPGTTTVTLMRATQPAATGYLMANVPINGSATHFYSIEARRLVGYDDHLIGDSITIHEIGGWPQKVQLMDPYAGGGFGGWVWQVGDTWIAPEGGIRVHVDATTSNGFRITVDNGLPVKSTVLSPVADAYVDHELPDTNFGDSSILRVRGSFFFYNENVLGKASFLRFDPAQLPPNIARARLRLTTGDAITGVLPRVEPYANTYVGTTTRWTESGLTWNNIADESYYRLMYVAWPTAQGANWMEWDIAGLMSAFGPQILDSLVLHNGVFTFSSREGANPPQLIVDYLVPPSNTPPNTPANPSPADGATGVATNATLSWTGGDPDAGDVVTYDVYFGTSNPPPLVVSQSATTYSPGLVNMTTYYWKVVARDSRGATTAGPLWSFTTVTAGVTTLPLYLSPTGTGTIDGKGFTGADILIYNKTTNNWSFFYDGSAAGTPKNVSAFAYNGADIILGFSAAQTISGVGTFNPQDLARFTPTRTGYNNTAGRFYWFFDGSDVGLTTSAEAIDASWIDAQGRLYISTAGSGSVPVDSANPSGAKITFQDEDILRFTNSQLGATTAGRWELYWNPSAMPGMSAEDINGYWEDPASGFRYVTILGAFSIGDPAYGKQTGNGKTIVRFTPNAAAPGGWAPVSTVTWLATGATFPSQLDAIAFGRW